MKRHYEVGEKFLCEDGYCEIIADRESGWYMCDHYIDVCDSNGAVIDQRKDDSPVFYQIADILNNTRIYGKF